MKRDKIKDARGKLGGRIKALRKAMGITQEELGERAGLNYKFIGELERGRVNVSLDSLVKIAEALDTDVESFFSKGEYIEQKVRTKEKHPFLKLSANDLQDIKKALRLLNKTFQSK